MAEYFVAWSASGVETVEAASWEQAASLVDATVSDHLAGLTVEDVDLEPRERAA